MKSTLSLAVLLLIGESSAHRHHHQVRHHHHHHRPHHRSSQYLQFVDMKDDLDNDDIMTVQSIMESERLHGSHFNPDDHTYKSALAQNNKLEFSDNMTFDKVFKIKDSWESANRHGFEMVGVGSQDMSAPYSQPVPGVTLLASDPIHGSLGADDKVKIENMTEEQELEERLRRMKPADLKDDPETVTTTDASIKIAEKIVGSKMPEPKDPEQMKKMKESKFQTPEYHLAGDDEEDPDTVETRRSVKTAEKALKQRFFINAWEQRQYEKDAVEGKINQKELDFAEGEDDDIGAKDPKKDSPAKKEAKEKEKAAEKVQEADKSEEEKKADKEEKKDKEKKDDAEKKEEEKKEADKGPAAPEQKEEKKEVKGEEGKEPAKEGGEKAKEGGDKGGEGGKGGKEGDAGEKKAPKEEAKGTGTKAPAGGDAEPEFSIPELTPPGL